MNVKISIIIPVYNVSKYLRRALDCAVKQTYREIEVIVINDCSPDPLDDEIMREYESKYPELIRLIFHKKNLGLGAARNTGIRAAKGEYILFLDSDDEYTLDACEKYYNRAKKTGADVVGSDCIRPNVCGGQRIYQHIAEKTNKYDFHGLLDLTMSSMSGCGKLILKTLMVENDLFFEEGIAYEDIPFTFMLNVVANKTEKIDEALYLYYLNPNSIITSMTPKCAEDVLDSCKQIVFKARKIDYFEKIKDYAEILSYWWIISARHNKIGFGAFEAFRSFVQENYVDIDNPLFVRKYKKRGYELITTLRNGFLRDVSLDKFTDINYIKDKLTLFLSDKHNMNIVIWGAGRYGKAVVEYIKHYEITNNLKCNITASDPTSQYSQIGNEYTIRDFSELWQVADIIVVAFLDTPSKLWMNSDEVIKHTRSYGKQYIYFNINDYI